MNAFTKFLVGTSMVRETQENIEKAGFTIQSVEYFFLDIARLYRGRQVVLLQYIRNTHLSSRERYFPKFKPQQH